ncbi:2'-5' RNA ligase family protein [Sediminibacterium ginsengisoli]|uniref:2'-5' RNA ligase superfamily protein n=1 Tax=Sediminibacterium ginsengisoli TaxID=413434 RepID=A0A1T4JU89_9BACT|nr:2'-5' RNA ligase family protein [Sediminibacterium ginsengisoli]SJZ33770.1 hypothetical protein SAMN04488132_101196 [Sediminibacterium ginsengisoli]
MEAGLVKTGSYHNRVQPESLNTYALVACPDTVVRAQLAAEKEYMQTTYDAGTAAGGCIMLAHFTAREDMEATLIRWMHRIISAQKSFRVHLNRYGGVPPHSIYLGIEDHSPFRQLATEMQVVEQYIRSYGNAEVKLISQPFLPLITHLPEPVYQRITADYADRHFHAFFEIKELVLLRRSHDYDGCRQVNLFGLQPA